MAENYLSVQQLNFYINNVFLEEELLHNVPVCGEVSGCAIVNNNCYFTLKDAFAQIKVCFFGCKNAYIPQNGERILVIGAVDYYVKGGQLSLRAYKIDPMGENGELHIKLEKLKAKLQDEGLFEERYKKEIPLRPKNVAVITSVKSAAFQDFFTTIIKKNNLINLTVIDVRVQGNSCASDVITALKNADEVGYDTIVLTRGGGAFEDLYAFNDEEMIRTIFQMKTPLISAIGHETDNTLCDFVADRRAITPTAAGELIGYDVKLLKNEILDLVEDISQITKSNFENTQNKLIENVKKIQYNSQLLYQKQVSQINTITLKIANIMNNEYNTKKMKIGHYLDK
ncbi:MAG: exodeoxyribonuclease VII large subunit, partial [Clostridia bacterium]